MMIATVVVTSKSSEIVLLKSHRLLEARHHSGIEVMGYASEPGVLEVARMGSE